MFYESYEEGFWAGLSYSTVRFVKMFKSL